MDCVCQYLHLTDTVKVSLLTWRGNVKASGQSGSMHVAPRQQPLPIIKQLWTKASVKDKVLQAEGTEQLVKQSDPPQLELRVRSAD